MERKNPLKGALRKYLSLFEKFKNLKIAVVGDLILDKYLFGKVERISPEAPVPIFEIEQEKARLGGAANVAANLKALGVGRVALLGRLGKDPEGEILKKLLQEKKIENLAVENKDIPTTRKTRLVARSQQLIRIDREKRTPLSSWELKTLKENLLSFKPHAVIVSDYAKGVFTKELASFLRKLKVPVIADPRPVNTPHYKGFTCTTPNLKEFSQMAQLLNLKGDFEKKALQMRELLDLNRLVVTLGDRGMALVGEGKVKYFPAAAREVYDVTGAGDTVVATLGAVVASGESWEEACFLANLAAGIVVGKLGTATATREEILKALKERFNG